ncbi:MAG TPA: LysM peptidoglycan-binding domain-containing protein [Pseudonocardiaceae bacterium]
MQATLVSRTPTAPGVVTFKFNPEQIRISRRADTYNRASASSNTGTPAGASGSIFRRATAATITISNIWFRGSGIKHDCDQLLNWLSPGGGLLGMAAGMVLSAATGGVMNLAAKLPTLIFTWGPLIYEVCLTNADINYVRFTEGGDPIRAKVTITMREQPSLLAILSTNPTSGGLPGRGRHTVSAGENLQSIATATYGSPNRWRAVAEANGIDDPARVRPGQVVYLPNPGEPA